VKVGLEVPVSEKELRGYVVCDDVGSSGMLIVVRAVEFVAQQLCADLLQKNGVNGLTV
jgi:hypothetical protein